MSDFRIGEIINANPASWSVLSALLGGQDKNYEPEWTFAPQASFVDLPTGGRLASAFGVATWRWGGLRFTQRQLLRAFCTGLSTAVYIRTATNETSTGVQVFDDFSCIMNWTAQSELIGINYVEQVEIIFTHLVAL